MSVGGQAIRVLAANTIAFAICFAVWMMYGVLVTYLVDRQQFAFEAAEIGWLIGIPVLSGSLFRLPAGMLADRFGGRAVMAVIMLLTGLAAWAVSLAGGFWAFFFGGLGFGIAGASFAAGVAYTSLWFPPQSQGTALGIFGMGNVGAALTSMLAPALLDHLTQGGSEPERWRMLPRLYGLALLVTAATYWLATIPRRSEQAGLSLRERLAPLGTSRAWRFGFYYSLLFGGFVALSQWLIPYYVNVYGLAVTSAGALASAFSLPAGAFRALGGWLSDRVGARTVLYWVLGTGLILLVLLFPPRIELLAPGQGVLAEAAGRVSAVTDSAVWVDGHRYEVQHLAPATAELSVGIHRQRERHLVLPAATFRQEPAVAVGDTVLKGQLLIRGMTQIYFQANIRIFTGLVVVLGMLLGVGGGAVFKHIATYFPGRVGVVGGVVSMIGALGGFAFPILFGYLLGATGIWTTAWMLLAIVALTALVWMHLVVRGAMVR